MVLRSVGRHSAAWTGCPWPSCHHGKSDLSAGGGQIGLHREARTSCRNSTTTQVDEVRRRPPAPLERDRIVARAERPVAGLQPQRSIRLRAATGITEIDANGIGRLS